MYTHYALNGALASQRQEQVAAQARRHTRLHGADELDSDVTGSVGRPRPHWLRSFMARAQIQVQ